MRLRIAITETSIADDIRRMDRPGHYLIAGAAPRYNDEQARTGYQGVVRRARSTDPRASEIVWRCEHRHRFARKAQECSLLMIGRSR